MHPILFYTFGGLILLLTASTVLSRNPVYSAGYLVAALFLQAGIYAVLGATFLAAIQILVYAGAIMVLFLFVVMLIPLREDDLRRPALGKVALIGGVILLGEIIWAISTAGSPAASPAPGGGSVEVVGRAIFESHFVSLEVLSLLLLAAIVGAVTLARRRPA